MGQACADPVEDRLIPLLGLDRAGVSALCEGLGLKPFQQADAFRWIYVRRCLNPLLWSSLPKEARAALSERSTAGLPRLAGQQRASDGTLKLLLELEDGQRIEAVYIPEGKRRTVCVSSQVGCAMGCRFCLTAQMGFKRNLAPGEILGQFFALEERTDLREAPYNVVFMGMGEPLANRKNLEAALAILEDDEGMGISRRRITVSTSGLADELEAFAASPTCPRLSLSLNAAGEGLRRDLMPVTQKHSLKRLREVLQSLSRRERERISLEYVLLGGVNDSERDARDVARFAKGLKVKVNLIPFNPGEGLPFVSSGTERVLAFQDALIAAGIMTSVRKSRGPDILAACGQLARKNWGAEASP